MISSYKIRYYTHPGSTQATQATYPLHIVSILYKGLLQEMLGTHAFVLCRILLTSAMGSVT